MPQNEPPFGYGLSVTIWAVSRHGKRPVNELADLIDAVSQRDLARVERLLDANAGLACKRDPSGATALHYAALVGEPEIAQLLVERGADINAADDEFGATPAGWAIEYLRELGGHLGIELSDLRHAIDKGDAHWVERFLVRFPSLRDAKDSEGVAFRERARTSGHRDIVALFGEDSAD